jgi:hypothetical protein
MALANDSDRKCRQLNWRNFRRKPAPDLIRGGSRFPFEKDAIEPNREFCP